MKVIFEPSNTFIYFLIYQSVLENFIKSDVEILKIKDSYSFSITYPNDPTCSI